MLVKVDKGKKPQLFSLRELMSGEGVQYGTSEIPENMAIVIDDLQGNRAAVYFENGRTSIAGIDEKVWAKADLEVHLKT